MLSFAAVSIHQMTVKVSLVLEGWFTELTLIESLLWMRLHVATQMATWLRNFSAEVTQQLISREVDLSMEVTSLLGFKQKAADIAIRSVTVFSHVLAECVAILVRGSIPAYDTGQRHSSGTLLFLFRADVHFCLIYSRNTDILLRRTFQS